MHDKCTANHVEIDPHDPGTVCQDLLHQERSVRLRLDKSGCVDGTLSQLSRM